MIRASVSIGRGGDAFRIGKDTSLDGLQELHISPTVVLVFSSATIDQDELVRGVRSVLPHTPMVGMSTAGEISSSGLSTEDSAIVVLLQSNQFAVATYAAHHLSWNAERAGIDLANGLSTRLGKIPKETLIFFDVLRANTKAGIFLPPDEHPFIGEHTRRGDNHVFEQLFLRKRRLLQLLRL